mgnify:CR=1 FL=1
MKYKNAIISTGKDILIVFICFFIFMFLSGGGTQNVLAAEDEVTITLDANGGKAVEPVVYKKTQSEIGILPETTRTGYVFNGWWTKNGGTSSSDCHFCCGLKISVCLICDQTSVFRHNILCQMDRG